MLIYLDEYHTSLYACMHACVCVCCILIQSVHGCVLILTEGLLYAAVYDGLSCCLFPRLSRLCLLCSDVQTSTASRNRDSVSLSLPSVLRGHTQRQFQTASKQFFTAVCICCQLIDKLSDARKSSDSYLSLCNPYNRSSVTC